MTYATRRATRQAQTRKEAVKTFFAWVGVFIFACVAFPAILGLVLAFEAGKSPENAVYVSRLLSDISNLF